MIDIHCHILPGLDDGPRYLDISLAMAAKAAADGISAIIATPHTDGIRVNSTSVISGVRRLNEKLRQEKIDIEIYSGYEIPSYLLATLGHTHRLARSNYVLLEFPHTHLPADALITVSTAISEGLIPIIAHPERNPDILERPQLLAELVDIGALAQLTASSLVGEQGTDVQRCSRYMLKNSLIHFIATDSHSPSFREPILSEAHRVAEKIVGIDEAEKLFVRNAGKIIARSKNAFP